MTDESAVRRVSVSPTKIDAWQDCRRRYRLQYVERVRVDGSWAHLSMGNSIHLALRDWFDVDDAARTASQAADLVRVHWIDKGFRDADQSREWRDAAAAMTEAYCERHPAPSPFGRERTVGALTEHTTVSGRIDRLDAKAGELVVVDYKTGRRVPTDEDARVSRALALYAAMVHRSLRRPAFEVQLHHVPSGVIASHRHTPESIERQLGRADSIGRDMAAAEASGKESDFAPSPGPLCGWCDFREHCPESSVTLAQARWAGLPTAPDDAG